MIRSAYQWGVDHELCTDELEWRKSLGPDATQADAYLACESGDWMIDDFVQGLTVEEKSNNQHHLDLIADLMELAMTAVLPLAWVSSLSPSALEAEMKTCHPMIPALWSQPLLSFSAGAEVEVEKRWKSELYRLANDIRNFIPEWPGGL